MEKETRVILERSFADEDVKKDYNGFDYVAPHLVVGRLNEAFGQDGWQFDLMYRIEDLESVTQYGRIGIKGDGPEWIWKENCGGMARRYSSGKPHVLENQINRVTDYKGAVSNCFKRCAMMLGVALDLYGDAEHDGDSAPDKPQGGKKQPSTETPKAGKGDKPTEGGPDAHFVDSDVVSKAELHAATLQLQTLVIKEMKSSTKDVQKELTGGEVNMNDAGDLDTYYKLLVKKAKDLGLIDDAATSTRDE